MARAFQFLKGCNIKSEVISHLKVRASRSSCQTKAKVTRPRPRSPTRSRLTRLKVKGQMLTEAKTKPWREQG